MKKILQKCLFRWIALEQRILWFYLYTRSLFVNFAWELDLFSYFRNGSLQPSGARTMIAKSNKPESTVRGQL